MLALTFFWNIGNGSLFAALLKGLLLFVILAGAVLFTAWLGAAVFAAIGAFATKASVVSAVVASFAKLPALTSALL